MNKRETARERKAFEKWCRTESECDDEELAKDRDGGYLDYYTDAMWIGWIVRAEMPAASGTGSKK
jgi:hypothetical protein